MSLFSSGELEDMVAEASSFVDNRIQEMLNRIEQDDDTLSALNIGHGNGMGRDDSSGVGEYMLNDRGKADRLGECIATNTHIKKLDVGASGVHELEVTDRGFFDGLKRNSSITNVTFRMGGAVLVGGVFHEVLKAYQENNNLTCLDIVAGDLQDGGEQVIANTVRRCTNLQEIILSESSITAEQLALVVEALRRHSSLGKFHLHGNGYGRAGCESIATLLRDPSSNLRNLSLHAIIIDNESVNTIASSLVNNTKLRKLHMSIHGTDRLEVRTTFTNLLCNKLDINSIHSSNHTLDSLLLTSYNEFSGWTKMSFPILHLNKDTNKSHVAILKILMYHPYFDMDPLYEWDSNGERTLKALPYVVGWFERAREAFGLNDQSGHQEGSTNLENGEDWESVDEYSTNSSIMSLEEEEREHIERFPPSRQNFIIEARKLSAMYQFARSMPLMFVPPSHIKVDDKKRKRGE